MARFKHETDRAAEQGGRIALDTYLENHGYKEERIGEVRRRATYAAELARLFER
jgi:hypothetical protein